MPPIPDWPEWDDPAYGGHAATGEFFWNAGAERILENGVDIANNRVEVAADPFSGAYDDEYYYMSFPLWTTHDAWMENYSWIAGEEAKPDLDVGNDPPYVWTT
jgi:hypothetical protein